MSSAATWPQVTDFVNALQKPAEAFHDPALKASTIPTQGKDRFGRPRPRTGSFAAVFRLMVNGQPRALRVYRSPVHASWSGDHYRGLSQHFRHQRRPNCLVHFHYDDEGIQIQGRNYPTLIMDWVDGVTLDGWVRTKLEEGDAVAVGQMAGRWSDTVAEMKREQLTHGDLQHGNIMVVGDALRLVDYDGLWLPALGDRPAPEAGLPAYQHPRRGDGQPQSAHLDDFSAWLILLSLHALAAEPDLWREFRDERNHDNLLFQEEDLRQHEQSPLWPRLARSPDGRVRQLAEQLRRDLDHPFDHGTRFLVADPCEPLRRSWQAGNRNWGVLYELAANLPRSGIPADLQDVVVEIDLRFHALVRLRNALNRIPADPRAILEAYEERWLADRPECAVLIQQVERARRQIEGQEQQQRQAEQARRDQAAEDLRAALAVAPRSDRRLVAAFQAYLDAGGPPPTGESLAACEQARARSRCLDVLEVPPAGLALDELDRWWVAAWDEPLLADCADAAPHRTRYQAARERLRCWEQIERALADRNGTGLADALAWDWLPTYPPAAARWPEIESRAQRGVRLEALRTALASDDRTRILGELEADLSLLAESGLFSNPRLRQRIVQLVRQRWSEVTVARGGLVLEPDGATRLRLRWSWNWPSFGQVRKCLIAVSSEGNLDLPPGVEQGGCLAPTEQNCPDGSLVLPRPRRTTVVVTLWPVLVVEGNEVAGRPCQLDVKRPGPMTLPNRIVSRPGWLTGMIERWLGLAD